MYADETDGEVEDAVLIDHLGTVLYSLYNLNANTTQSD